jgi:hypothetical protein
VGGRGRRRAAAVVGQHRYALDEYSWEIPEGGVAGTIALDGAAQCRGWLGLGVASCAG